MVGNCPDLCRMSSPLLRIQTYRAESVSSCRQAYAQFHGVCAGGTVLAWLEKIKPLISSTSTRQGAMLAFATRNMRSSKLSIRYLHTIAFALAVVGRIKPDPLDMLFWLTSRSRPISTLSHLGKPIVSEISAQAHLPIIQCSRRLST